MQLIRKGGFRERANRHAKYQNSENQQATLVPHHPYQPNTQASQSAELSSPPHTEHINQQEHGKTQK